MMNAMRVDAFHDAREQSRLSSRHTRFSPDFLCVVLVEDLQNIRIEIRFSRTNLVLKVKIPNLRVLFVVEQREVVAQIRTDG